MSKGLGGTLGAVVAILAAVIVGLPPSEDRKASSCIKPSRDVTGAAVNWLASVQTPDGSFGDESYLPRLITTAYVGGTLAAATGVRLEERRRICEPACRYIMSFAQPDGALCRPNDASRSRSTEVSLLALAAIGDFVLQDNMDRDPDMPRMELVKPSQLFDLYRRGIELEETGNDPLHRFTTFVLSKRLGRNALVEVDPDCTMYALFFEALILARRTDGASWEEAEALKSFIEERQTPEGYWLSEGTLDCMDLRVVETALALRALSVLDAELKGIRS